MRPLPRVHAITDGRVLALDDLGVRAAAIAAGGPSVALHARDPAAAGRRLAAASSRFVALARPPEASVLVNGRPDIARATGAQGVQLRAGDLAPTDARHVLPVGWIGSSVHSFEEAHAARAAGTDFLMVGNIYPTPSHPALSGQGLQLIVRCASLGVPVIAIGGITPERAREVRAAGAYGVASISSLWYAADPAEVVLALLEPWLDDA